MTCPTTQRGKRSVICRAIGLGHLGPIPEAIGTDVGIRILQGAALDLVVGHGLPSMLSGKAFRDDTSTYDQTTRTTGYEAAFDPCSLHRRATGVFDRTA